MRKAVGAMVAALLLCSCADRVASTAPPDAAAQPDCELSAADALKLGGSDVHQMTAAEFAQWGRYAAKHGAPMAPGMSAWVIPHVDAQDDDGVLVAYQGCVVLWVHPFTTDEIGRLFKSDDLDGHAQDGPEI